MSVVTMEHVAKTDRVKVPTSKVAEWEAKGYRRYTRYVWARFTANPVEHITHDPLYMAAVCGAQIKRLEYGMSPSGLAPVCMRCLKKEAKA